MIGVLSALLMVTIITSSGVLTRYYDINQLSYYDVADLAVDAQQRSTGNQVTVKHTATETRRIAFVTFSHLLDFSRFETYVFPALDTFLVDDIYYVVLRNEWKEKYYNELCTFNQTYTDYCRRVRPIFVDCPEGKAGKSPCCKQQKGLLQLLDRNAAHTGNNQDGLFDWFAFYDDDVYIRSARLRTLLHQFAPESIMLITGSNVVMDRTLGQSSYSNDPNYTCSITDHNFTYPWGQPVFYTRGALQLVASGLRAGGLMKQCEEFQVTHDAGNAIFHWMYSIPEVRVRFFTYPTRHDDETFGSHGVGRKIKDVYGKKHKLAGTSYFKMMSEMAEVHRYYLTMRDEPLSEIVWHNVTGFQQTHTYQQYGDPTTWNDWHTMPIADCMGPVQT